MSLLNKIVDKMTSIYLLVLISIITGFNIFLMYFNRASFMEVMVPIVIISLLYFISERYLKNEFVFALSLFLLSFMVRAVYGIVIDSQPISDFKLMVNAAIMINQGDTSYKDWLYFIQWPYQLGFVSYQALVLKVFKGSKSVLILLNCLYMAITTILVYGIGKAVFTEKVGRLAAILHFAYLPFIYYAAILTNQHIATVFFMTAIWFILRHKNISILDGVFAGIALAFGQSFRPLAMVYLLAILLFVIYIVDLKKIKRLIPFAGLIATYLLVFNLIVMSITAMGISDNGLSNTDPYWKFVPGLNQASYGRYNDQDNQMFLDNPDNDLRIEIEKELINERLFISPLKMLTFQFVKVGSFWGDYENSIFGLSQYAGLNYSLYYKTYSFEYIFDTIKQSEKAVYTLIFIGVLAAVWNNKKTDKRSRLLIFLVCFYTGIHLFIEVSVRYRYDIMGIVIILAAKGLIDIITSVKRGIKNEG